MRHTITLDEDIYLLIQSRASYNKRSMNKEIVFLLEAALAVESEGNLDIIRALFAAQGGVQSFTTEPLGSRTTEH